MQNGSTGHFTQPLSCQLECDWRLVTEKKGFPWNFNRIQTPTLRLILINTLPRHQQRGFSLMTSTTRYHTSPIFASGPWQHYGRMAELTGQKVSLPAADSRRQN